MPDFIGLTALVSLTIGCQEYDDTGNHFKLRALPRGISELGSLRELSLWGLDKLRDDVVYWYLIQ
jgi:hypothetical protein